MDTNGFYHDLTCKNCGKPLQGMDSGYPAESYAGTWTGLCYPCTNAGPFLTLTEFDNAQTWSFPPHCPAWRRDRETFIGYPDCEACNGKGRKMISRSMGQGGPYPENCRACHDRYFRHPLREWEQLRRHQAYTAANNAYIAHCLRFNYVEYVGKGKKRTLKWNMETDNPVLQDIRTAYLTRYRATLQHIDRAYEKFTGACFTVSPQTR